jgi:hypothetical protein
MILFSSLFKGWPSCIGDMNVMKKAKAFFTGTSILLAIFLIFPACTQQENRIPASEYITIDEENPWYWNYKGKPVLLLGLSWQDNLFNHPTRLDEHLDVIQQAGGNYLRNTMSHRNVGNEFAFERDGNGLFDLKRFNKEYWIRFENFLDMAYNRDIIVQLEIWDPWDYYEDHQSFGGWSKNPFNPANNINYTSSESGLPEEIQFPPKSHPTDHPFFHTVPELEDNTLVLLYQQAFFDRILSISLNYPNVLYCIHNEVGEPVETGDYWARRIHEKADLLGVPVYVTDMRRSENVRSADHLHIVNNHELYSFLDISQNNATRGLGSDHYESILFVRERVAAQPRPINNIKNYGAARHGEEESISRMGRIVFGGCASARFHRPHPIEDPNQMYEKSDYGLGASPRAQRIIKTLRMVTDQFDLVNTLPRPDLISSDENIEAYLLVQDEIRYAIYFPSGGNAEVQLPEGEWNVRWINFDQAQWETGSQIFSEGKVQLTSPDHHHRIVFLERKSLS